MFVKVHQILASVAHQLDALGVAILLALVRCGPLSFVNNHNDEPIFIAVVAFGRSNHPSLVKTVNHNLWVAILVLSSLSDAHICVASQLKASTIMHLSL